MPAHKRSFSATRGWHDAFGNRIERSAWNGSTTVERFAVDGWDTAKPGAVGTENFDVWADLSGSNTLSARRVMGGEFDQVLAKVAASVVTWYGVDRQGSVRQVLDNSGSVIASSEFDGYGNLIAGSLVDRYGYTGREWDSALGLYYYRGRMYAPPIGRFTSEDPLAFAAGDANLYRYVGNGPTNGTDPSGHILYIHNSDKAMWKRFVDKGFVVFGKETENGYLPLEVQKWGRELTIGQGALNFHDGVVYMLRKQKILDNSGDNAIKDAMVALFDGGVRFPDPNYHSGLDRALKKHEYLDAYRVIKPKEMSRRVATVYIIDGGTPFPGMHHLAILVVDSHDRMIRYDGVGPGRGRDAQGNDRGQLEGSPAVWFKTIPGVMCDIIEPGSRVISDAVKDPRAHFDVTKPNTPSIGFFVVPMFSDSPKRNPRARGEDLPLRGNTNNMYDPNAPTFSYKDKLVGAVKVKEGDRDDIVRRLDFAFAHTKQIPWYNALHGPNSNSYARQLLSNAGFSTPPIPWDAPGWVVDDPNYRYGGPKFTEWGFERPSGQPSGVQTEKTFPPRLPGELQPRDLDKPFRFNERS